jgi:hypothetical protein
MGSGKKCQIHRVIYGLRIGRSLEEVPNQTNKLTRRMFTSGLVEEFIDREFGDATVTSGRPLMSHE